MTFPLLRDLHAEEPEVVKGVGAVFAKELSGCWGALRGILAQVSAAFGEREIDVVGGATPADSATSFPWGVGLRRGEPRHVLVSAVRGDGGVAITTTAPVFVSWFYDGTRVQITQVFGLTSGTKYTLRLAVFGGL